MLFLLQVAQCKLLHKSWEQDPPQTLWRQWNTCLQSPIRVQIDWYIPSLGSETGTLKDLTSGKQIWPALWCTHIMSTMGKEASLEGLGKWTGFGDVRNRELLRTVCIIVMYFLLFFLHCDWGVKTVSLPVSESLYYRYFTSSDCFYYSSSTGQVLLIQSSPAFFLLLREICIIKHNLFSQVNAFSSKICIIKHNSLQSYQSWINVSCNLY